MKKALITGITGQDGAYLADFLIEKGYEVHGIKRRTSLFNTERINHIYNDPHEENRKLFLHYGDLTDGLNITRIISEIQPDEIYNLGAMSHVKVSFEEPEYTANADGLGVLRILEAVRILGLGAKTKIYQASTSEMYGLALESPQHEKTPFYPRSPYAIAKLFAHWTMINYREAYNFFAVNGILFNHESPVRGETFVTRKISRAVADIYHNQQSKLYLGNLNAIRDWGHARDYVQAMWMMLQAEKPEDFVIATGNTLSVRDFTMKAFMEVGIELEFTGTGDGEKGLVKSLLAEINHLQPGDVLVEVDPNYRRPTEVDLLRGDASKAKRILGWEPRCSVNDLIKEMVGAEMKRYT
jgi:GDPmannose 4,6-dehydratase